jgi:hypothetical protein
VILDETNPIKIRAKDGKFSDLQSVSNAEICMFDLHKRTRLSDERTIVSNMLKKVSTVQERELGGRDQDAQGLDECWS